MSAVLKWNCEGCGQAARKTRDGRRWVIVHHVRCPDRPGMYEDTGPVTSVNDPDNALYVSAPDARRGR